MKKIKALLLMACCALCATAGDILPQTVQGIQYQSTMPGIRSNTAFTNPTPMAAPDGQFTFDMIESWAGEGENKAALVIQWNTGKESEKEALVFGFRWNGQATGADMVRAVISANPRLYGLIQYTNVSSPTDPNGGYTINGFGWDADESGPIQLRDNGDGKIYDSTDGLFIHPRGYVPGQGGNPSYDYDNWEAVDPNDYWQAGWFSNGYWSYWVKDSYTGSFSYSGVGASGRVLKDGCWDGWNFAVKFGSYKWNPFEAAPSPMPADAKTQFTVNGICYTLKSYLSKTVEVSAPFIADGQPATEYSGQITIPESFTDTDVEYTVTAIGEGAFQGSKVTAITLPASVTEIGSMAFESSTLEEINISDNIKKIGSYAFMGCPIKTPFFPTSVTEIAEGTYYGSEITTAIIPARITAIGDNAFAACAALKEIDIPGSITSYGEFSFGDCQSVTSIKVRSTYPPAIDQNMFSPQAYANAILYVPSGYSATYAYDPVWGKFAHIKDFKIDVNIGDKFAMGGITYVVTSLGSTPTAKVTYCKIDGVANNANIRAANKDGYTGAVSIPDMVVYQGKTLNVTAINDSAFIGATELTQMQLPSNLTYIPKHAFNGCAKLSSVNIPASVTEIGLSAFSGCSALTSIELPSGLNSLPQAIFENCSSLTSVNIPSGVTAIPSYAFAGCSSLIMEIPAQIKTVGSYAFRNCTSLTTITLPDAVTAIANYTFAGCTSLTKVTMSDNVTQFGSYAFQNCRALSEIELSETTATKPANVTKLPSKLTSLMAYSLQNCTSLNLDPELPKLTQVGNYAFSGMKQLADIKLPEGLKSIGMRAFESTSLKHVVIPSTVTSLSSNYMFYGCTGIKVYLTNPTPVTVGTYTFRLTSSANATVIVPSGTKEAYDAKNSIWKKLNVTEPELTVAFGQPEINATNNSADIYADLAVSYADEATPNQFMTANAENLKNASVKLSYTETSDNAETVEAEVTMDGNKLSAHLTGLKTATSYSFNWTYALGTLLATSDTTEFTTASTSTGIDGITATDKRFITYRDGKLTCHGYAGHMFTIHTLSGTTVAAMSCTADTQTFNLSLTSGIYIIRGCSNSDEITVKLAIK